MKKNVIFLTALFLLSFAAATTVLAHQSNHLRSHVKPPSYMSSATATASPTPIDATQLSMFDGTYQEIIAELQSMQIIPEGGSLVYQTQYAYFDGRGAFYTPLAVYHPHTNVVMAGELKFRPGESDELQLCMLGARMTERRAQAAEYLFVGMDDEGDVLFIDQSRENLAPERAFALTDLDITSSHEFLIIVLDDNFSLYVDGSLVLESDALTIRDGTYGIALASDAFGAHCEANNIWIYELDLVWDGLEGVCGITVNRTVNLRAGPGIEFALSGEIQSEEVLPVSAQTTARDGYVWWQLSDERWVRADLVRELGNCEEAAPFIELQE